MKTSYFANLRHLRKTLSICRRAPEWYAGPRCQKIAPPWELSAAYDAGEIDEGEYTVSFYRDVLSGLSPRDVYSFIAREHGEDVVLLCYERPGEFCHRRIVASWFEESLGVDVPEFTFDASPLLTF